MGDMAVTEDTNVLSGGLARVIERRVFGPRPVVAAPVCIHMPESRFFGAIR